jgi:hypothetical protein
MLKKILPLLLLLLLSACSMPSQANWLAQKKCLPKYVGKFKVSKITTYAKTIYQGSVYSWVSISGLDAPKGINSVFREKDGVCYLTYYDVSGHSKTMSEGAPHPVAVAFSKDFFQTYIKAFGRTKLYQKYSSVPDVPPEDVPALQQLGFPPLPKSVRVRPWAIQQPEVKLEVQP